MAELRERITATIRREVEEKIHHADGGSQPPTERAKERPSEARQAAQRQSTTEQEDDEGAQEYSTGTHGRRHARSSEQSRDRAPQESSAYDALDRSPSDESETPEAIASPELGRALQEQINQALQPALAEFREQIAATVRNELDETLHRDRRRASADAERATDREPAAAQASSDDGADQSATEGRSKGSDPSGQRGAQAQGPLLGKPLFDALPGILEQQGEQWLRSRLDVGIDFVFAHWVRAAIQQEVERTFRRVTRAATDLISDRATREELRAQADRTVESMVGAAFDRLFADDVRDDLKARAHQAIGSLFQPDLKSIAHQVQELLLSLLEGLLAVLRECWEHILQLLGRVVLALLQPRLTGILKDAFASLATTSGREADKRGEDSSAAVGKDEEPRRPLAGLADDEAHEDDEERETPRRRARDSEESVDRGDNGADRRPGRAPSGRPPADRPPASRHSPGRSSPDRSVSGLPSRTTSR